MLLERKRRKVAANHEGSWAVSYVDMLTLLLCFFIIFFNSKNLTGQQEATVLSKVIQSMNQNHAEPTSAATHQSQAQTEPNGNGNGHGSSVSTPETALMEQVRAAFDPAVPAKLVKSGRALEIVYDEVSFFDSGSTRVTPAGETAIRKIIPALAPHRDRIRITVQGHTDPTRVRGNKHPFGDNWELSVLRATAVLKRFLKAEFPQENLTAEGFADTQAPAAVDTDGLSRFRTVTFRIVPKEEK